MQNFRAIHTQFRFKNLIQVRGADMQGGADVVERYGTVLVYAVVEDHPAEFAVGGV